MDQMGGRPATPGAFCSGCGNQLDAVARFCSTCGSPRAAQAQPRPALVTMSTTVAQPRRSSGGGPGVAIKAIGATVFMVVAVSFCVSANRDSSSSASSEVVDTTTSYETPSHEPTMSPEESLARRLAGASTVDEALAIVRPSMGDGSDDVNAGTAMMALWAAAHLELDQVRVDRNETSVKAVLKDPDAERGKRMCVKGSVGQITKDTSVPDAALFVGQLRTTSWEHVRFYAAGSTQGIVEDTRTRFCGVVTGRYSFSNAMGGTTHTAELVGMFDIPANRPAPPVAVKPPPGVKCLDPAQYTEYGAKDIGLPLCGRPATAKHSRPARERAVPAAEPDRAIVDEAPVAEEPDAVIDPFEADPEAARRPAPE